MPDGTRVQVVGIVEDGKYTANLAEDPQPAMFLPILQFARDDTCLVVRSERDPQQLAAAMRSTLRDLDPDCLRSSRPGTRRWTERCLLRAWPRCRWACWG